MALIDTTAPVGLDDMWSLVQDVWLRLMACATVQVQEGELPALRVQGFKRRVCGHLSDLRTAALDAATYTCREASTNHSIVQWIECDGDDLLLTLTPLHVIQGWPGGYGLAMQLRALIARLGATEGDAGSRDGGARRVLEKVLEE